MQCREAKVFIEFDNKHGEFRPSAKVAETDFSHFEVGHWLEIC
jgi:hypothetical protein